MTNPYKHKSVSLRIEDIENIKELSENFPGQLSNAQVIRLGITALKDRFSPKAKKEKINDRSILDTREKSRV